MDERLTHTLAGLPRSTGLGERLPSLPPTYRGTSGGGGVSKVPTDRWTLCGVEDLLILPLAPEFFLVEKESIDSPMDFWNCLGGGVVKVLTNCWSHLGKGTGGQPVAEVVQMRGRGDWCSHRLLRPSRLGKGSQNSFNLLGLSACGCHYCSWSCCYFQSGIEVVIN